MNGSAAHDPQRLKHVPTDGAVRDRIRRAVLDVSECSEPSVRRSTDELAVAGRSLLERLELSERYLGYTMVLLSNACWRSEFLATPFDQRLLLLPNPIAHRRGCRRSQPWSEGCAACTLEGIRQQAEELGYQVLTNDATPRVLQSLLEGRSKAVIGIADLDVLEKAIEKVLVTGVPSCAIPVHQFEDADWIDREIGHEVLDVYQPHTHNRVTRYHSVLQTLDRLFTTDFARLLPRHRSSISNSNTSPLATTEAAAYDWLSNGGKRFRPFITLAAYDALKQEPVPTASLTRPASDRLSDAVCRVAMAIEAFHKASLVHDDIQDDDQFRYGRETLHRTHGIGPAINIGDYLIGLGYRLVNACRDALGPDVAVDIVHSMSGAHIKLCDGQGAEMAWQQSPDWSLTPEDALQIYALKTSPAFEAALFAGVRMAGSARPYDALIPRFAQRLGVGFQVLNDLKDWQGDADNKLIPGQDALAIRPTVLLALAVKQASSEQREELRSIYESTDDCESRLIRLRELFAELDAFSRAEAIVEESRDQAELIAASVDPPAFRRLLTFLVDTVLAPEATTNVECGHSSAHAATAPSP